MWFWFLPMMVVAASALVPTDCPGWMRDNGFINDLGLLADAVSWSNRGVVRGVCAEYVIDQEVNGLYETRVRVYTSRQYNLSVVAFRPTQQTPKGQSIHTDRQLAPCAFFPYCQGRVHKRFQEAFLSLVGGIHNWSFAYNDVATVGHSLGGSLQLFMGVYLWETLGKLPILGLGLAGPFIGDEEFTMTHLQPYFGRMQGNKWQVEVADANDSRRHDGTVEDYQVGDRQLCVLDEAVCRFRVHPLTVPMQAYGLHDLKQYRLFMSGEQC